MRRVLVGVGVGRAMLQRQLEVAAAGGEARREVARHGLAGPRLAVVRAQPLLLAAARARAAHALHREPRYHSPDTRRTHFLLGTKYN